MLYPGSIVDRAGRSEQEFIPLLKTSSESGLLDWDKFTSQVRLQSVLTRRCPDQPQPSTQG